ncbi:MAG: class I SAM-dependent methyltransferase [Halothiobacillaceae bacterium]|nr:class I SAM-dependent methyltransferase [Halothiobacillaceae bacterium]
MKLPNENLSAPCPLCGTQAAFWQADARRPYLRCPLCELVFVPSPWQLDSASEKSEYDKHRNALDDPGYRRFLERPFAALRERVSPPAEGLDFGCGPGPLLARLLEEEGFSIALYDPFYANAPDTLSRRYDFITATEVFEHLREPGRTLQRLLNCLRPGGWLVVMTKRVRDREAFARWHYTHDPTHVAFFSETSFTWIAKQHNLHLDIVGADVIALRKAAPDAEKSTTTGCIC